MPKHSQRWQERLLPLMSGMLLSSGPGADAVTELAKAINQDLDSVETAFQNWFTKF